MYKLMSPHGDYDHIAEAINLVENFTVEKVIFNCDEFNELEQELTKSKTSSSKNFINEINPKYSIISVGKNNRYGHPNVGVLDNLSDLKIYRTDIDGSIIFNISNNKLRIETCPP